MKKRKARQAREAAHAAEAVTSTAAHDTGGADVDAADTPIVADDDGEDADPEADIADQVEIAEVMYKAALTRGEMVGPRGNRPPRSGPRRSRRASRRPRSE